MKQLKCKKKIFFSDILKLNELLHDKFCSFPLKNLIHFQREVIVLISPTGNQKIAKLKLCRAPKWILRPRTLKEKLI